MPVELADGVQFNVEMRWILSSDDYRRFMKLNGTWLANHKSGATARQEKKALEKAEAQAKVKADKEAKLAGGFRAKVAPVLVCCTTAKKQKGYEDLPRSPSASSPSCNRRARAPPSP